MLRHGMSAAELRAAGQALAGRPARPGSRASRCTFPLAAGSHLPEVERLLTDVVSAGLRAAGRHASGSATSPATSSRRLRAAYPDFTFRPRIGTDLWLGDRAALRVSATVLDVHALDRGDVFGYRGRTAPRAGHLLVVSGGTAHGIGLEAPLGDASLKGRAATLARGGLDAVGFVRSPFSIDGKQRLFAEPPHMQASMLFLPAGAHVPGGRRRGRRAGALHRDGVRPGRRSPDGLTHRTVDARRYGVARRAPGRARAAGRRARPGRRGRARRASAPRSPPSRRRRRRRRRGRGSRRGTTTPT